MRALVRTLLLVLAAAAVFGARGDAAAPQAAQAPPTVGPPAPVATAPPAGRDIEDFVPSEHVKADDAVAFPTDI